MEKVLSLLTGVTKMTAEELKEKIETEDGYKEIEGKIKGLNVFTPEDLTARDERLKADHIDELILAIGKNEVPNRLYNGIKGNVMEQLDKDLAEKLSIESFIDHNDLIGKIQNKKADGKIDEKLQSELSEYKSKVEDLNKKLEEKDGQFSQYKQKEIIKRKRDEIINNYPYSGKSEAEKQAQKEVLSAFIDSKYKFDIHEDQAVLVDQDGKPLKDSNTLKVIDPFEKIKTEMAAFVPQDNGAEGGEGNKAPGTTPVEQETTEQFEQRMSAQGKSSAEISQLYQQRVKEGKIVD